VTLHLAWSAVLCNCPTEKQREAQNCQPYASSSRVVFTSNSARIYMRGYIGMCVYIYIHTHIYIHIYIYIYIYISMWPCRIASSFIVSLEEKCCWSSRSYVNLGQMPLRLHSDMQNCFSQVLITSRKEELCVVLCLYEDSWWENARVSCHSPSASASSTSIIPTASELIVQFHGLTQSVHASADTVTIFWQVTYTQCPRS